MKKITVIIFALVLAIPAFAQLHTMGFGLDVHTGAFIGVDSEEMFIPKTVSVAWVLGISDNFDIKARAGYSMATMKSETDYVDNEYYDDYESTDKLRGIPIEIALIPYMTIKERVKLGAGAGFGYYNYTTTSEYKYGNTTEEYPEHKISGIGQFVYMTIEAKITDNLGVNVDFSKYMFANMTEKYESQDSDGNKTADNIRTIQPLKTGYSVGLTYYLW